MRTQIEDGALQPGDQLPGHRALAARFGVSLGAAREAISILIGDGTLETRHGRGTFVALAGRAAPSAAPPLTRVEVLELIEARELLGLGMVTLVAQRGSPAPVARLRRAVDRMRNHVTDAARYSEAEAEFHLALADAAGNRFLLQPIRDYHSLLGRDIELACASAIERFGSLQRSAEEHDLLVAQIESGAVEAARETLSSIMRGQHEFLLGFYAPGSPGPRPA